MAATYPVTRRRLDGGARGCTFLIQWLAYGGPARAARGRPRPADGRGSRGRGSSRRRARDQRPRRAGHGCPGSAPARCRGRCSSSGSAATACTPRRSSRTSAAGSGAQRGRTACARRSRRPTTTSSREATARRGASRPSSRTRGRSSRPTGRRSRCRGSSPRSPTRSSRASSEVLQRTVAPLSPIEGRLAREGDVAVVDIVSDEGPGQRDYVVEIGSERLLPELEDTIGHLLVGDTEVDLVRGAERLGHVEGALRARAAAARRLARDLCVRVRDVRRAQGRHRPRASRSSSSRRPRRGSASRRSTSCSRRRRSRCRASSSRCAPATC